MRRIGYCFGLGLLALTSILSGPASAAPPKGITTSPLNGYPGVVRVERVNDAIKVEVARSYAASFDDQAHDDWLSGIFGRYHARGEPISGVWEYVRDAHGRLEPLDRLLPRPTLPDELKGVGSLSTSIYGPNKPFRYQLPLPYGGGLQGKTIVISPGHGLQDLGGGKWEYQRSNLKFDGCGKCAGLQEDLFTSQIVHRHLIPLLLRAGARVYTPREWDYQTDEVIVDDSDPGYEEEGTGWVTGNSPGGLKGGYRVLAPGVEGSAHFTPTLTSEGWYWVSVRYVAGTNRSTATRFLVDHGGGTDEIVVDQRQDDARWIYLGRFWMGPGAGHGVRLLPTDGDAGHLIADAVRFGGGIHSASKTARWHMSALQHLPYLGAPASVLAGNDVTTRPLYAEWQGADVYLSVHSNATGSVNTVAGTSTYRYNCGTYPDHSTIPSASACDYPKGSDKFLRLVHQGVMDTLRGEWDPNWRDRGRLVANFGELRVLDAIPGALIELAFHDNTVPPTGDKPPKMPDNRALQEPKWRRLAAWGMYKGLLDFLNEGGPLALRPPRIESVLTELRAEGIGVRVRWQAVDKAKAYRVYVARGGKGFDGSLVIDETNVLLDAIPGEPVYVQVSALNEGGESLPSEVLGAASQQGLADTKQVLIVQGYDREDAWTGEGGNTFDYVFSHGEAIAKAGWGFHSVTNEAIVDESVSLGPYRIVNWLLGKESNVDATFDAKERALILDYVQGGGRILATGSEIGWDLVEKGDSSDFLNGVFGAAYEKDDAKDSKLVLASGSVLGDLPELVLDDGTMGVYDVDYPDVFRAEGAGATLALKYSNGDGAAVAYDKGSTRAFLAGFPIEAVHPTLARNTLMKEILLFLDPDGPPEPIEFDAGVDAQGPVDPMDADVQDPDGGAAGKGNPQVEAGTPGQAEWQTDNSGEGCACRSAQGGSGSAAWWIVTIGIFMTLTRRRVNRHWIS